MGRLRHGWTTSWACSHSGVQALLPSGAPGWTGRVGRGRGICERPHLADDGLDRWALAAHMTVDRSAHGGYVCGCGAATATDNAGTGVNGEGSVSGHQFRRAGVDAFGALEMRNAAVALDDQRVRCTLHRQERHQNIRRTDTAVGADGERCHRLPGNDSI